MKTKLTHELVTHRDNFGTKWGRKIIVIDHTERLAKKKKNRNKAKHNTHMSKRIQPATFKILVLVKQKPFIMVNEDVCGANVVHA